MKPRSNYLFTGNTGDRQAHCWLKKYPTILGQMTAISNKLTIGKEREREKWVRKEEREGRRKKEEAFYRARKT